jgi:type IV pilus assembly protein PilV
MKKSHPQSGVSLIEVLVAIVILSFGMLALGGMLAYAVQLPKLSSYRSTATQLAADYIERVRANSTGFLNGDYQENLSYDGTFTVPAVPRAGTPENCTYPNCTPGQMATTDKSQMNRALRLELPAGGMRFTRADIDGLPTSTREGDLWIIWQEPSGLSSLNNAASDNCPSQINGALATPAPRCLYIRFSL